ncbi:MAG: histidinol-phosphate aminotransferase [Gaiellaceae bacterium]|nr:histidinol-phosphate aminotransferase [Gaiellaceae bacterium]
MVLAEEVGRFVRHVRLLVGVPSGFLRPALTEIVPYEPGKPVEEVQRELGLERVVKLASNEGPYGPFPRALEALDRSERELNRYPDGGAYRLRTALAELHGVRFEEVATASGADALIDGISQAALEPGNEVVFGWPSFPSYAIYARKLGAVPVPVPLKADRYDLPALLAAVTARTKIVYICHPNNPTGTMSSRAELDDYFERVPEHVVTVLDQAYFEYIDDAEYADGIAEYFKSGRSVVVLRTFSKIYGLAGLRVGYGVAADELVQALGKTRRAFDLATPAQEAALASLDFPDELVRRREANAAGRTELTRILTEAGYRVAGPAVGNFVFADLGEDAQRLFTALLREGVIVRPLAGFGAPEAIRVTVGTPDEHAFFAEALTRVRTAAAAS